MSIIALLAVLAMPATPPPSVTTPSPYEIFARARASWESQHYPAMLEYTVAVTVTEGGQTKTERYHLGYDGYNGTVLFNPVSDYEKEHPYYPTGINVGLPFMRVGRPEPRIDFLGVPDFVPNYGFGLGRAPLSPPPQTPSPAEIVREVREAFHDPDPRATPTPRPAPSASPALREIVEIATQTRTYDISVAGIDDIGGAPAYHLKMRPLREPKKYRLRDLWVDTASFMPRKLVEALNFVDGPGTAVPWSVTFANVGGVLYIGDETAMAPMAYRGLVFTQATVSVQDVHTVSGFSDDLSTFIPGGLLMEEP